MRIGRTASELSGKTTHEQGAASHLERLNTLSLLPSAMHIFPSRSWASSHLSAIAKTSCAGLALKLKYSIILMARQRDAVAHTLHMLCADQGTKVVFRTYLDKDKCQHQA